jgi:hypothetical protein
MAAIALMAPTAQVGAKQKQGSNKGRFGTDVRVGVDDSALFKAKALKLAKMKARALNRQAGGGARGYKVGDKRWWPAWDDTFDFPVYLKKYKLRAVGPHIEVWVAAGKTRDGVSKGTWYPEGDCRNDYPDRIKVTNAQVKYFINEFETNMYPVESEIFSVPPARNGEHSDATLIVDHPKKDYGIGKNYYKGKGRRIVTLVDNVRDPHFYDTDDSQDLSRTAGFFSGYLNEATDRNVMTIDSWNWKYGLGENPPTNPVPGNVCESVVGDPFLYEEIFAHEYQHLLEYYADSDGEMSWIDEGMADYAAYATGYTDPSQQVNDADWDGHIQCFLGNIQMQSDSNPNPPEDCGPENSLTWWGDQDEDNEIEILADYGAAFMMQLMLAEEYGQEAITFLHNDAPDGLDALQALLDQFDPGTTSREKIHQWAVMVALDGVIDDGAVVNGGNAQDYQVDALHAYMDWTVEDAYSWPGAPPNGSDYVRARHNNGTFLNASEIDKIEFAGAKEFEPTPTEWVEDTPADWEGGSTLYSTAAPEEFDSAIAREVDVPQGNAVLTFDTKFDTEYQWDFGFVQVSDDGGETWKSLANEMTTSEYADGAYPTVQSNVPGFTGESGVAAAEQASDPEMAEWVSTSFSLAEYAGETVWLSFRYVTDWAFQDSGFWVDNVVVGDTTVSEGDDLGEWSSLTEVNPANVEGFTVQLVTYTDDHTQAWVGELPLDVNFEGELSGAALDAVIGTSPNTTVLVLVMFDESTEEIFEYAPYELRVNNQLQPGGE